MDPVTNPCHLLRCPHLPPPPYRGVVRCTVSGRNIGDHATAGHCAMGYFGRIRGLGDVVARLAFYTRGARLAAWWKRLTGWGCNCAQRRRWLNRVIPLGWWYKAMAIIRG